MLDLLLTMFIIMSQITASIALVWMTYRLWKNTTFLTKVNQEAPHATPEDISVSILVPSRNEETNIEACVRSLADQHYPDTEIIVLNDHSEDKTGDILETLSHEVSNLRVIHSEDEVPNGWTGKNYACHRLAAQASGDILLFTDADTIHHPDSVSKAINRIALLDVDMLSVFPYQRVGTWLEKILVSFIVDFLPMIGMNLAAIPEQVEGSVLANGQFIMIKRTAYDAIGGHAAIKDQIVDDFALAKQVKSRGDKLAFLSGIEMLSCRMYHTAQDVWEGFSKNIMLGLQGGQQRAMPIWMGPIFAFVWASIFVLPLLIILLTDNIYVYVSTMHIFLLILLRRAFVLRFNRPKIEMPTTHIAGILVIFLGVSAIFRNWQKKPVTWKGRQYGAN